MTSPGIVILLGLGVFNGLFSPYLSLVYFYHPVWYPSFLPVHKSFVFFLCSLFVSTMCIMFSGILAALYQRVSFYFFKHSANNDIMYGIWIGVMAVITIPTLDVFMKLE